MTKKEGFNVLHLVSGLALVQTEALQSVSSAFSSSGSTCRSLKSGMVSQELERKAGGRGRGGGGGR